MKYAIKITVTSTVFIADAQGHIKRIICGRILRL